MRKNSMLLPLAGLVVLAVVLGLIFWNRGGDEGVGGADSTSGSGNGDTQTDVAFLGSTMPEDWFRYRNASEDIDALTPDQHIGFFIIEDPAADDVAYFAASAYNADDQTVTLGMYRYDEPTYQFERIYRGTYAEGEADWLLSRGLPVWHLVAYDRGSLIVLAQDIDDSPGRCAQPFLLGTTEGRRLFSLDLEHPSSGLVPYEPDVVLLEQAQTEQDVCLEQM